MVTPGISNVSTISANDAGLVPVNDPDAGCVKVNFSAFQPHDDSKDVVSTDVSNIINNVCHTIIMPAFFVIGVPLNVLNMAVFFKQGLKQRINLCLFCLSLIDLLFLIVSLLLYVEKMAVQDFKASYRLVGRLMQAMVNSQQLAWQSGLGFASVFVSAVIAVERCLCVVWPLKSALVLTSGGTGGIVLSGALLLVGGRFLVVAKYRVVCVLDVDTQTRTLQVISSQFYQTHKDLIDILDGVVYALVLLGVMFGTVIIATIITAVTLQKSVRFKKEVACVGRLSPREVAVTRMLIYLSVQFVVLASPSFLLRVLLVFLPALSHSGAWANLYFLLMAVVEVCATLNSSLNFLVYYFLGSKYRHTLRHLLGLQTRSTCSPDARVNIASISSQPSGFPGSNSQVLSP